MTALLALVQPTAEHDTARRRTATVGTPHVEIQWLLQDVLSVWMLFALHWKAVMYAVGLLEQFKEWFPCTGSLLAGQECLGVANDNQRVACSGQKDVESFRSGHETYVSVTVATSQASYDNVGLVALEVI